MNGFRLFSCGFEAHIDSSLDRTVSMTCNHLRVAELRKYFQKFQIPELVEFFIGELKDQPSSCGIEDILWLKDHLQPIVGKCAAMWQDNRAVLKIFRTQGKSSIWKGFAADLLENLQAQKPFAIELVLQMGCIFHRHVINNPSCKYVSKVEVIGEMGREELIHLMGPEVALHFCQAMPTSTEIGNPPPISIPKSLTSQGLLREVSRSSISFQAKQNEMWPIMFELIQLQYKAARLAGQIDYDGEGVVVLSVDGVPFKIFTDAETYDSLLREIYWTRLPKGKSVSARAFVIRDKTLLAYGFVAQFQNDRCFSLILENHSPRSLRKYFQRLNAPQLMERFAPEEDPIGLTNIELAKAEFERALDKNFFDQKACWVIEFEDGTTWVDKGIYNCSMLDRLNDAPIANRKFRAELVTKNEVSIRTHSLNAHGERVRSAHTSILGENLGEEERLLLGPELSQYFNMVPAGKEQVASSVSQAPAVCDQ